MTADAVILSDAEAAQRRAADPEASVWVAASAGTGKTKVLTDRVLSLMLTGTRPQHILCLTFTRAAAAEMSNRIAEELGEWAAAADEALEETLTRHLGRQPDDDIRRRARRLFAQVLDTPGGMNIQTIHAFCQSLLGRFPLEAGIAPHFTVLEERDAEEMLAAAREEVLARPHADGDGPLPRALPHVTPPTHPPAPPPPLARLPPSRPPPSPPLPPTGPADARPGRPPPQPAHSTCTGATAPAAGGGGDGHAAAWAG